MSISRHSRWLSILLFALACGPAAAWGQTCPAGTDQSTLATPPAGALCGKEVTAGSATVYQYLGIPYAQPPVGALRWKNPVPYPAWTSPRTATAFGSDAAANCSSFWDSHIGYEQDTLKTWSRMLVSAAAKKKKR